jgi:hypothetical protein
MTKVVMRAAEIMLYDLARNNLRHTDVLIEPDTTETYRISRLKKYFDENIIFDLIRSGEVAAEAAIPEIKKLLGMK